MTPEDLRFARQGLQLSLNQMAADLGMSDSRTIRRWESGDVPIPGSVAITIAYWRQASWRGEKRITV